MSVPRQEVRGGSLRGSRKRASARHQTKTGRVGERDRQRENRRCMDKGSEGDINGAEENTERRDYRKNAGVR